MLEIFIALAFYGGIVIGLGVSGNPGDYPVLTPPPSHIEYSDSAPDEG